LDSESGVPIRFTRHRQDVSHTNRLLGGDAEVGRP
jgi:hypothetical protein